jgi:hypothetical protein
MSDTLACPDTLTTSDVLVESLQTPTLKSGGASSSSLLNRMISRVKRDVLRASVEATDAADAVRVLALTSAANNSGMGRQVASLQAQVAALTANGSSSRALADFYGNALTLDSSSVTTADINPLFGQATLPTVSRQNVLCVERGDGKPPRTPADASILYARQPYVNSTENAQPPADYLFGEDLYSAFALDNNDLSSWVVEDPALAGHMVWVEVRLPGKVSGAYRCNEIEFVPSSLFGFELVSVRAEVVGSGWRDVDFSYLNGYQGFPSQGGSYIHWSHFTSYAALWPGKPNAGRISRE